MNHWLFTLLIAALLMTNSLTAASASAQVKVDLQLENVTMVEFFNRLTHQTGFEFVYQKGIFDNSGTVNVNVRGESLEKVLDNVVVPRGYNYSVLDRVVTIKKSPATQQPAAIVSLKKITGKVVDNSGEILSGATVILVGTNKGALTDINGNFEIAVPSEGRQTLKVTFLGMTPREIALTAANVYEVVLTEIPTNVSEIVVTGYQTISRERSAGAYSSISGSEIADKVSLKGNILESLEGISTGLSVNYGDGEQKYLMRGTNSFKTNQDPLYIVDGVPMSADNVELMINENDIARVTMLKDATAASIWGAQAANGVIVITTKKGYATSIGDGGRRLKVSYNGSFTYRGLEDHSYFNYMSSDLFIKTAREVFDPAEYPYNDILTSSSGLTSSSYPLILPHEVPMYQYYNKEIEEDEYNSILNEFASRNNRSQIESLMMQPSMFTKHSLSFTGGTNSYAVYSAELDEKLKELFGV